HLRIHAPQERPAPRYDFRAHRNSAGHEPRGGEGSDREGRRQSRWLGEQEDDVRRRRRGRRQQAGQGTRAGSSDPEPGRAAREAGRSRMFSLQEPGILYSALAGFAYGLFCRLAFTLNWPVKEAFAVMTIGFLGLTPLAAGFISVFLAVRGGRDGPGIWLG